MLTFLNSKLLKFTIYVKIFYFGYHNVIILNCYICYKWFVVGVDVTLKIYFFTNMKMSWDKVADNILMFLSLTFIKNFILNKINSRVTGERLKLCRT